MPLSPLEKLDAVLKTLSLRENANSGLTETNLVFDLQERVSYTDLKLILSKLERDNYVIEKHSLETNNVTSTGDIRYFISFDGLTFLEQGGYKKQSEIVNQEIATGKILNWAVAVGGGVAAVYYFLEICRVLYYPC